MRIKIDRDTIIKKVLSIGKIAGIYESRSVPVKVTVEVYRDRKKRLCLSMVGDILNWNHQDIIECGQIQDTLCEAMQEGRLESEIPKIKLALLLAIWKEYHLNDMQAACSHMAVYCKHTTPDLDAATGFDVSTPCPICGYKHGHSWNFLHIPNDIIAFLRDF